MGAEVVVGDLLDRIRCKGDCRLRGMYSHVGFEISGREVNVAAVAMHHEVKAFINMSQMTLSQMSITETTASPQHKLHWLAEHALNWSGLRSCIVRRLCFSKASSRVVTPDSVRESTRSDYRSARPRLRRSQWKTARVVAALLAIRQPHIGKIYHLTGPQSENMHFYAQEYSKALGRTINFRDIPVEPWRDALLERGLPVHLVNHLATMRICSSGSTACRHQLMVTGHSSRTLVWSQLFVMPLSLALRSR